MGCDNYKVNEVMGSDSFGTVSKGTRKSTCQIIAIKVIPKNFPKKYGIDSVSNLREEIKIYRELKHEYIIEMLDSFENRDVFFVVTEYAKTNLFEIIEEQGCLPEKEVQAIAKQLVSALHYLHSNKIMHQNLKLTNILICEDSVIKLCDFGFARVMALNDSLYPKCIEDIPLYSAPEKLLGEPYSEAADLWSLGIVLYELFSGYHPFHAETPELVIQILKGPVEYPDKMSSNLKSLIRGLLYKEPEKRLNWTALLEHPFINETSEIRETKEISAKTVGLYDTCLGGGSHQMDFFEIRSLTVNGAKRIGQNNVALSAILVPLKSWYEGEQVSGREQDIILSSNQSLRILVNLIAASAVTTFEALNMIARDLLGFMDNIFTSNISSKSPDINAMIAKSLLIMEKLVEYYGSMILISDRHLKSSLKRGSDIPQLLIDLLLSGNIDISLEKCRCSNTEWLSPVEVVWAVTSVHKFVSGEFPTCWHILVRHEIIKLLSDLISDTHLKLLRGWSGYSGGENGIRDTINAVIDLLALPFVEMQIVPGDKVAMEDKDMVKANIQIYIELLVKVGVPHIVLHCLEYMDLKDVAKPVAFLAKMTCHWTLAFDLSHNGLLDSCLVRNLLTVSCPTEVFSDVLMIVSNLADTSEEFCKEIAGANLLEYLKGFLTHEDPKVCANTCRAIGNMCRHTSFYTQLVKHHIIGLLIERCADPDKLTRSSACFAIRNVAHHDDKLYEELRNPITQLAKSPEEDIVL